MLDPKAIIATIEAAMSQVQGAHASLSQQFMSGVSGMNLSGSDSASAVMDSTSQSCRQMMEQMEKTFASLQSNLDAHQAMQRQEVTADFNQQKNDLRDTLARGFPAEDPAFLQGKPRL
ncbi:DUF6277 family protein [Erwinia sp. B116]|uniref:DUF6277 family protein n=1 Tax=Erwinia sp. B116 TaxID=1561024 RepID=UPI000C7656C0|nr:DUF6277 family protein [Erwinia sp. B116]